MARPLRIEFPGAWYHVMNRGLGKRSTFLNNEDRQYFLNLLGEISKTFHIEIHAFSLINNHYHLLIYTPEAGLGRAMRHLNGVYTQKFNWRHNTDGPLFRGRYKALIIDSDNYLLELIRYIHLNPVKAGLCDHPGKHSWTSHIAYIKNNKKPEWLITTEIMSRFSSQESKARRQLEKYVLSGVPESFERELKTSRVMVASKGFKDWVLKNFVDRKKKDREVQAKREILNPKIDPQSVMNLVKLAYNVDVTSLRKSKRGRGATNDPRSMAAYLMRRFSGLEQKKIARWVNCPNEYTVATIQKRFKYRLANDRNLRRLTNELERSLMTNVKT